MKICNLPRMRQKSNLFLRKICIFQRKCNRIYHKKTQLAVFMRLSNRSTLHRPHPKTTKKPRRRARLFALFKNTSFLFVVNCDFRNTCCQQLIKRNGLSFFNFSMGIGKSLLRNVSRKHRTVVVNDRADCRVEFVYDFAA